LTRKRPKKTVENTEYAAFTRRILAAYARRVAAGDVEALRSLGIFASDVDTATRQAVTGLRTFGYSWSEIADRLGVTRQAAQMRWGERSDRGRLDERIRCAETPLTVPLLVTVYIDHFRTDSLTGACPGCGFPYEPTDPECPTLAVVAPLLYRRRHENHSAVSRLTPAQASYLHDRRGTPGRGSRPAHTPRSGSSLFESTQGGR
jgi:hypothetical protein